MYILNTPVRASVEAMLVPSPIASESPTTSTDSGCDFVGFGRTGTEGFGDCTAWPPPCGWDDGVGGGGTGSVDPPDPCPCRPSASFVTWVRPFRWSVRLSAATGPSTSNAAVRRMPRGP